MYIPQLQVSKAKYEASMLMKKYEKNGEGVQLKPFNHIKANDDVAHKFSSNVHIKQNKQIGGKAQVPSRKILGIRVSSNMQYSREEIKEIFQYHDSDNDGFLNIREVTKAFAFLGSILPLYKAYHGMVYADTNKDGLISEDELDKLIDYASKFFKKK